jgi:hypothetical protein
MPHHHIALADHDRPGSPSKRADKITAFSTDMLATENAYHAWGLIAITVYVVSHHPGRSQGGGRWHWQLRDPAL